MKPRYEEKTFESYFNSELDRRAAVYFPFGQVQEGGIGADASALSRSRWLWWRLGHPFWFRAPFAGADLREVADEMEHFLGQEVRNIPSMKANLLFQYKRPELITSKLGSEWAHWNEKYFRYDIYHEQQVLLAHLDSKFGSLALILYASPALVDVNDLVSAKKSGSIIESTNFRKASELTGHHRNTYVKAGTHSVACSDPISIERLDLLSLLKELKVSDAQENSQIMVQFAKGVRSAIEESDFFGAAYRMEIQEYVEAGLDRFPLLFSLISMSVVRQLVGVQWVMATSGSDV